MKISIRLLFYVMTLVSVILFVFTYKYVQKLKLEPIATIEGVYGSFVLNNQRFESPVELQPGRYTVVGASVIKLFNGRMKVVKLPHFEVEVVWEK